MAVKIIDRIYNEIYTEGETDWLLANVGEWQKLKLTCEVSIDFLASQESPIEIDYVNNAFILSNGDNWGDYGFDDGMTSVFKYKKSQDTTGDGEFDTVSSIQQSYTITNIYGSTMEVSEPISVDDFESIPVNYGTKKISEVLFFVYKIPEGCKISYGHILNEDYESQSLNSFIDETESEFVFPELSNLSINDWGYMEAVGIQSGMSIRSIRVREIPTDSTVEDYKRHFEIEIQYMISSIFEELSNLENLEFPSYLSESGSLTDNFKVKFFPEWNNPNVMIQNDMTKTKRLGNTGWFNENYNELNNDFEIESVKYFDENGNPTDGIDYSSQTKVQVIVNGVPNLNSETECGFGFAWIPTDEDDYKNKETPFYRNLFVQSGSLEDGFLLDQLYTDDFIGAGIDGGSMDVSQIKFTSVSGKIVFEANFLPNTNFYNLFEAKNEDDRNYILWLSVADGSLVRNLSDRVSLLADVNLMVKNIPLAGNYDEITNAFIEHPNSENAIGETALQGIIQDDILCRMPLRIPTDGSKVFQKITFGVEAYNLGLSESQELEKHEIDLTQFPFTSDGVHQINVDAIRGFKLNDGNNKNWVKISRESSLDVSGLAGFICYFATKIRWEDWIQKNNVDTAFFDSEETNNGFHNDWIHYLETQGWSIKFFAEIISNESGDLFEYKNRWDMDFVDYDENENIAVTHKYFRDSDDTLLNVGTDVETGRPLGVILQNEPTRIEIEFEILDDGVWDINSVYAVTTIEIDKGAGRFEQRQLSSVWESESDNPLKPITNQTKLKIEIDGTNKFLKTTCLVDPDLLDEGTKYRITGRVGCLDESEEFSPGLYEFRYENKYE